MADEVDDADVASAAPDAPTAPLKIVSHDHEIARAMKTAAVETEKSPAKVPAGEGRTMAMPPVSLLTAPPTTRVTVDEAQLHATAERLVKALSDYQIIGTVKEVHPGPVVPTYEGVPAAGTKVSRIAALSDDVAMSLEASKVRIVAPDATLAMAQALGPCSRAKRCARVWPPGGSNSSNPAGANWKA